MGRGRLGGGGGGGWGGYSPGRLCRWKYGRLSFAVIGKQFTEVSWLCYPCTSICMISVRDDGGRRGVGNQDPGQTSYVHQRL